MAIMSQEDRYNDIFRAMSHVVFVFCQKLLTSFKNACQHTNTKLMMNNVYTNELNTSSQFIDYIDDSTKVSHYKRDYLVYQIQQIYEEKEKICDLY